MLKKRRVIGHRPEEVEVGVTESPSVRENHLLSFYDLREQKDHHKLEHASQPQMPTGAGQERGEGWLDGRSS